VVRGRGVEQGKAHRDNIGIWDCKGEQHDATVGTVVAHAQRRWEGAHEDTGGGRETHKRTHTQRRVTPRTLVRWYAWSTSRRTSSSMSSAVPSEYGLLKLFSSLGKDTRPTASFMPYTAVIAYAIWVTLFRSSAAPVVMRPKLISSDTRPGTTRVACRAPGTPPQAEPSLPRSPQLPSPH
jgi:hypothetical protein